VHAFCAKHLRIFRTERVHGYADQWMIAIMPSVYFNSRLNPTRFIGDLMSQHDHTPPQPTTESTGSGDGKADVIATIALITLVVSVAVFWLKSF
jgi:hypothetical protein